MTTTTTQMGLRVPQLGDPSPGYVSDIATTFATVDGHDHTSGRGAPLTQASIGINGPLPLNGQALTQARNVAFSPTPVSPLSSISDNGSVFMYANDLYFLDGNNQLVRLTATGRGAGAIGGDYAAFALAQVSYSNADLAYYFRDSANNFAKINPLSLALGPSSTTSGNVTYVDPGAGVGFNFRTAGSASTAKIYTANIDSAAISCTGVTCNGSAVVSSLNAVGGVLQGSRIIGLRGQVSAGTLGTPGSYPVMNYLPGTTPSFVQATFFPPYAGSLAALTIRAYGSAGSSGSLQLATSGFSANATTASATAAQITSGQVSTYSAGTYTFSANAVLGVNVTSTSWSQSTTGATGVDVVMWVYA